MVDGDDPDGSRANETVSRAVPRFVYDVFSGAAPRFVYDIFALAWIAIAGLAVLIPALSHGAGIYSYTAVEDKVDSAIPLSTLAWREVHAGHLPLWNPYSALGLPLAFNLNSMAFQCASSRRVRVSATCGLRGAAHHDPLHLRRPGSTYSAACYELGCWAPCSPPLSSRSVVR